MADIQDSKKNHSQEWNVQHVQCLGTYVLTLKMQLGNYTFSPMGSVWYISYFAINLLSFIVTPLMIPNDAESHKNRLLLATWLMGKCEIIIIIYAKGDNK